MKISRVWLIAIVMLGTLTSSADALLLCVKKSGAVMSRQKCKKGETALSIAAEGTPGARGDQGAPGPQGAPGVNGLSGSPDTANQVRTKFFNGELCPGTDPADIMVKVGPLCVDKYEVSVWDMPTGGLQYGIAVDDYPCDDSGNNCALIFARSVLGESPSRFISWFQAQQACKNSGKRLLTNAEWQMAAAGTPDPEEGTCFGGPDSGDNCTDDGDCRGGTCIDDLVKHPCNIDPGGPTNTGRKLNCVSVSGINDMVGNVWEWVADWDESCPPDDGDCSLSRMDWPMGIFGWDISRFGGFGFGRPGGVIRGGDWDDGREAGVFAIDVVFLGELLEPKDSRLANIGFRCGR
jgi:hypothetical protein